MMNGLLVWHGLLFLSGVLIFYVDYVVVLFFQHMPSFHVREYIGKIQTFCDS